MNKQNSFSNKTIEALKMAIEALEDFSAQYANLEPIINSCKEALASPSEALEQQARLVPLNADEIDDLWDESSKDVSGSIRLGYTTKQHYFYVLIEQALKEKNKC